MKGTMVWYDFDRNLVGYLSLSGKESNSCHLATRCCKLDLLDISDKEGLKSASDIHGAAVVACYANGNSNPKWESLLHMGRRIIVVGDLNIAPSAIDRCDAGPEFDNNEFRRWFRSILTQYKRAKPESILSAHRWKGGRSIKLEGSDHAPVFMTLVDIPDVSLHLLTKDKFLRASKNQSRSVTKAPTMKGSHGIDIKGPTK
ncbi:hypothetical protein Ahy_B03g066092 isoform D [Arachis hypogaea]|uniref:Endonuclease/exonuclease/phosphatase domain-containing protein n=1 Tax=Arachis hypogaea TaxID=3818 RepID=A0A445A321_ARAHY|nr:hypothetical protein Ahy_B03g066092 isoform D [Arachis hypogaea]